MKLEHELLVEGGTKGAMHYFTGMELSMYSVSVFFPREPEYKKRNTKFINYVALFKKKKKSQHHQYLRRHCFKHLDVINSTDNLRGLH